jgi:hypothetical protein
MPAGSRPSDVASDATFPLHNERRPYKRSSEREDQQEPELRDHDYMIFQEDAIYGQAHKAVIGELIGSEMRTHSWILAPMYFE